MSTSDLSIKELAAYIGVSTDTIRRAARAGEMPFTRIGTAYRFDLRQVEQRMEWNARIPIRRGSASAPGGKSRPRAVQNAPGLVTRGTRGLG
jgi:excisionase family DNA binding protein